MKLLALAAVAGILAPAMASTCSRAGVSCTERPLTLSAFGNYNFSLFAPPGVRSL